MLTSNQLEELQQYDTPTIANAIERFNVRSKTEGFFSSEIKCILPADKPFIGYVCTAKVSANKPATNAQKSMLLDYYKQIKLTPNPTMMVIQDMDPSSIGSFWGEVNVSIHKALGCVGVITNGGVRDLDEVVRLGFGYFASCILVSHANIHLEDYNCPVNVGGLKIEPGDLVHADKHGAIVIPNEIAPELAKACRKVIDAEKPVILGCRKHFDKCDVKIDDLKVWREEMEKRRVK